MAEEIPLNPKNLKAIAQPAVDAWVASGCTSEGRFEVKAQIKVLVNEKWGGYNRRNDIVCCTNKVLKGAGKTEVKLDARWEPHCSAFQPSSCW